MKRFAVIFLSAFVSMNAYAADTLSSTIDKATVFLSGAQVFRTTKSVTIKKGVNEFVIKDVSPYLNQQQVQATALGNFLVLDVQFQTEYIAPTSVAPTILPEKIQKEINALSDSLLFIGFEKERIQFKLNDLNEEKNMVKQNQLIKQGGISDTLPEFKAIVEFYRKKLDEINELLHSWKKQQHLVALREKKHQTRLNELNNYSRNVGQPIQPAKTRYHLVVTTYSDVQTYGKVQVNYLIPNAGWVPAYDLRADNTNSPMTVTYKAHVYQNSGEDWDNVDLILSTYNHNVYAVKPEAGIWRLDYVINKPGIGQPQYYSQNITSATELSAVKESLQEANKDDITFTNQQFVPLQSLATINQNLANIEFDVKLPYSIKSDGSQKLMVITNETVDAEYFHYILPRVNKNGFLQAKISDWESLSLLPGKANIYFNHTLVGSTQIDPNTMSDTLELTMGKDQNVIATRKKIDEEVKKTGLGKRIIKTYTFEVEVRNLTRGSIDLTLEDLIPITSNEEITIKLVDKANAEFNEDTGRLTWKLPLKASEKKTIQFSYSIEHDKDKPIS